MDRESGIRLVGKYLKGWKRKTEHSIGVADFAYRVARRVDVDPDLMAFLGYVHDIGYSRNFKDHENATIDMLTEEGYPPEIALMTMHGQLYEHTGDEKYLPKGIEGMILTYADMSVFTSPMSLDERRNDIIQRVENAQKMTDLEKEVIIHNLDLAMPRFRVYEETILALAGAESYKDFF